MRTQRKMMMMMMMMRMMRMMRMSMRRWAWGWTWGMLTTMTITMTMTMTGDTEHEEQEETPSLLLILWFAIWVRWLRLVTMCSWLVPVTVARFCVTTMFVAPLRLKKLLVYIPSSWTFVLYRRGSLGDSACLPDGSSLSSIWVLRQLLLPRLLCMMNLSHMPRLW